MDTKELKENFTTQLKTVKEQIIQLETDLEKAKEYKAKLEGGLETLELLEKQEPSSETPEE
jgi:uncharacterized protein (DUF342 family)